MHSCAQNSMPAKWLQIVFKAWAVFGFLVIVITTIRILLLSFSSSNFWIHYGNFTIAVFVMIFLIPFWGAFRLRKWVLPILFVLALISLVNILSALLKQPFQLSDKFFAVILANIATIIITFLAYIFRDRFIGTFRKSGLQIIFFIFAIPALAINSLTLFFPDLPKVNDADLMQPNIILPSKEENAYFSLIKINKQIDNPTGKTNTEYMQFLEGEAWNQAEVDLILNKNDNVLKEIRRAAIFPYYQCPATAEEISFTTKFCPLSHVTYSTKVASLSALSRARTGDFVGAIEDALVPVRIGQLLIQEPRITLLDYLIGDRVKATGLKTIQILLTRYKIPSETLLPQIAEMEKYAQNKKGLENALRAEYLAAKNGLMSVNKIDSNFYIQPNRFFTEMAEDTRQQMALANTKCYQLEQKLKEYQQDLEENSPKIAIWKLPFMRNAVLEVLKNVVMLNLSGIQRKGCEADLLAEQTRLQMALEAYKYDNGEYPTSQLELVPDYITMPITNPFTNHPFVFSKDTGKIMLSG